MIVARILGGVLGAGGIAYLSVALFHVARFRPRPPQSTFHPAVTLLVPACGTPPHLAECLESLCRQDYPLFQVVFGLQAADDPARPIIKQLIARHPGRDMTLVIDDRRVGANPKNSNLANMLPAARHDLLVMVDSDIVVERSFLATIVQPLADPAVGGVTCLYKAAPEPDVPSRLGALYINDWFIPSVLADVGLREMRVCYGAAIASTRRAIEAIGGFSAMADAVAQDYVFGYQLLAQGYQLRLADTVVETIVAEKGLRGLLRHELRWSRSVRAVRPIDHALSIFMSSLVPAALFLFAAWPARLAAGVVLLHISLRMALHALLRRRLALPAPAPWLLIPREALNFIVWLTSFLGRKVRWGDGVLVTSGGLSMRTVDSTALAPSGKAPDDERRVAEQ